VHVRRLALVDYRSYPSLDLVLDPGPTLLVGANGQGKTNIVEAVGYVATLGSHRASTDAPLVRSGATRAVIRAALADPQGGGATVELELVPGRTNRARVNGAPVRRARDVLGLLRTVLFAPEDLAVVRGDPAERRRMLDDLLVARAPRWAGVRADYERVLKQRNALLRTAGAARRAGPAGDLRTLDVWDSHLAETGAVLLLGRLELVEALAPLVADAYAAIAPERGDPCTLEYRSSLLGKGEPAEGPTAAALPREREVLGAQLLAVLASRRAEEVERGTSLVGPHRDELLVRLGDLPVRGYASHGEGWSVAVALRLAAYDLLRAEGPEPVLVLDDVFAELDAGRRDRLVGRVAGAEQLLITAAVAADVPMALDGGRFDVGEGVVTRVR